MYTLCPPSLVHISLHIHSKDKAYSEYCSDVLGSLEAMEVWDQRSVFDHCVGQTSFSICSSMWWALLPMIPCAGRNTLTMHGGYQYMSGTWTSCHRNTQICIYILGFFLKENFVVQKSPHKLSLIGKDASPKQSKRIFRHMVEQLEYIPEPWRSHTLHVVRSRLLQVYQRLRGCFWHNMLKYCSSRRSTLETQDAM